MLVNAYDDERTMEEEENLSDNSCSNELDDLEKEGNMPLEALLAMYGHNQGTSASGGENSGETSQAAAGDEDGDRSVMSADSGDNEDQDSARSSSESEILENQDLTLDKDEIARDLLSNNNPADDRETSINDLLHTVSSSNTSRLLRSNSQPGSEATSDSEADIDYMPEEDRESKKVIQVGHDYQATVPEGFNHYGDAPAYENEDRLLWNPSKINPEKLEAYLREVKNQSQANAAGVASIPTGSHIGDDEQALYLLHQCDHNVEEALRRRKMQNILPSDPMSLWSEEECQNFEMGLRVHGKNFHQIQQTKVRTRSVGELVQFYYMWKKSERHDHFASKNRLEKRKYHLHPGVTDYMDRFLDEQESGALPGTLPGRDRSASPMNSLIYGDHKRSVPHLRQDLNEVSSTTAGSPDLASYSTATTTTLHAAGASGDLHPIHSSGCEVGSSAASTCIMVHGSKAVLGTDASLDRSGSVGLRGSDLNGNNEDSEVSEPACKKVKMDSTESNVGSEQQADSSSSSSSSSLLPSSTSRPSDSSFAASNVAGLDSSVGSVLKSSELSASVEGWGQSAAESVGM
ncbi:mesoderm induction early response protein 1-like [Babylonia areolata]|uniref:mesoderm induction early response protein 1-like n=1 Tax=Babylonia areolata TaxID=304850 RepID=UPI003FD512A6